MSDAPLPRPQRLILAKLRGFCAGVVRAIDIVDKALEVCGRPVYVRHEIVHNRFVVDDLRAKGAVFVDELDEVPPGSWVVFSAHGVAPDVWARARARGLKVFDATCPLVTKVHLEALHFVKKGYTIFFIGHAGHDEAVGTLGEAPGKIRLIETVRDAEEALADDPAKVAYLTQTTLSVDDTKEIVAALRRRFPLMTAPPKEDICYATTNRQHAVKMLAPQVDLLLVLGAPNSSNSLRLVEVGKACGKASHLIERAGDIRPEWLEGARSIGLTAAASAPEVLVKEVVDHLRWRYGVQDVSELETVTEDVEFALPPELQRLLKPVS